MKLGRKNEILKVSDIRIGTVLTFKGLNELTGPDGDYYDKRNGKIPLFTIGTGVPFFDKKFIVKGFHSVKNLSYIKMKPFNHYYETTDYLFSLSMFKEFDVNDPDLKWDGE